MAQSPVEPSPDKPEVFSTASVGGSLAQMAQFGPSWLPAEGQSVPGRPAGAVNVRSMTLERQRTGKPSGRFGSNSDTVCQTKSIFRQLNHLRRNLVKQHRRPPLASIDRKLTKAAQLLDAAAANLRDVGLNSHENIRKI
jgi:hypothetical protein